MTRYLDISLDKRGVTCVARLLDDLAPRTCDAVWNALPLGSDVYHAKYARNEIYTLVEAFADPEPSRENPTITPIPGDVVCYDWEADGVNDHVGLFEKWVSGTQDFSCLEGNTSGADNSNGGQVMRRTRSRGAQGTIFVRVAEP